MMGGKKWLVRAVLVASAPIGTVGFFSVSALLPVMEAAFSHERYAALAATLIPGVTLLAFGLSAPFIGALVDRYGYRLVYVMSLIAFALLGITTGFMPNLIAVLFVRTLTGAAIAGVVAAGSAGIATLPAEEQPGLFGLQAFLGGGVGIPLFPLTGLIAQAFGWRWVFIVYLVAVPALLACPLLSASKRSAKTETAPAPRLRFSPSLVLLACFMGVAMFCGTTVMPFAIRAVATSDPALIAGPLTALSLVSLLGSGGYGFLERKLKMQGMFAVALCCMGVGLLACGLSHSLPGFFIGEGVLGMGLGCLMPNLNAVAAASAKGAEGKALSLVAALIYGVQALLPFLLWPVRQVAGLSGTLLAASVVAFLLTGFILLQIRKSTERGRLRARQLST